jgi:tRNA 2-selenouridine synthase SelU
MKKPLINEFNDLLINNDSLDAISQDYKKKISKEIKEIDRSQIKNTILIKKKYSIWERILKTLGIN